MRVHPYNRTLSGSWRLCSVLRSRGGVILVQLCEDWSERLARVELLGRRRIIGVHIHHEVGVFRKESHLTFRIAAIRRSVRRLRRVPGWRGDPRLRWERS